MIEGHEGPDQSGESGCTELLSSVIVLDRYNQMASALPLVVSKSYHWAVRSTKT